MLTIEDKVGGTATLDNNCEEINGISVQPNETEPTQVTSFVDEATVCATVDGHSSSFGIYSANGVEDLKRYLARPHAVTTGVISSSVGRVTNFDVQNTTNWASLVSSSSYARMAGILGYRATICFKVVVSSTPFNQGILCLNWQYQAFTGNTVNHLRGEFPSLCVNLPHVLLDISENTSAELRVPYVSTNEFQPYADTGSVNLIGAYGRFTLTAIAPCRVGAGASAPNYVLYSWLEDVELIGARTPDTSAVSLQSGGGEKVRAGIVSNILDNASKLADSVGRIPVFNRFLKTPAWLLSNASNVAAAFGYSKPVISSPHMRVSDRCYQYDSQIDVPTPAVVAGPFQTNEISVDGTVGCTYEDQMSFDSILTRPQLIFRKEITAANNANSTVYGCLISPSCMWYRESGNGNISAPGTATITTSAFAPVL